MAAGFAHTRERVRVSWLWGRAAPGTSRGGPAARAGRFHCIHELCEHLQCVPAPQHEAHTAARVALLQPALQAAKRGITRDYTPFLLILQGMTLQLKGMTLPPF